MNNSTFKRVMAILLAVLTVLALAVPVSAFSGNYCTGRTKDTVYLRTKATSSTSSKYLVEECNTIPENKPVDVIGVSGTYFKVDYNGYQGYVKISEITVTDGRGTAKEKILLRKTAANSTKSSNRVEGCDSIAKGEKFTITGASSTFFEIKYGIYTGFARMKDVVLTDTEVTGSGSGTGSGSSSASSHTDQTGYKPSYTACTAWTGRVAYMELLRKEPNASTASSNMWLYVTGGGSFEVIGTVGTSWLFVKYDGIRGFLPKKKVLTDAEYLNKYQSTPVPTAANKPGAEPTPATPAAGATPVPGDVYTAITPNWNGSCKETVWLRSKAESAVDGTNNVKRTTIPSGASVTVLGESGNFYYISYGTYVGFARKIDIVNATATAPTSTDSGGSAGSSSASQPAGDVWGSIQIPGTNINYKIYSNALKSDGTYKYGGYDYVCALTPYNNPIAIISGHNMRNRAGKSNSMFHELHHVQNALSNGAKCERCGASTGGAATSTFNIAYNGSTRWQVVLFYETPVETSDSVKLANLLANGASTTLDSWLKMQYNNCSTYKGTVISNSSSSKYMLLVTCGDLKGAGTGARLYFVLAAVN